MKFKPYIPLTAVNALCEHHRCDTSHGFNFSRLDTKRLLVWNVSISTGMTMTITATARVNVKIRKEDGKEIYFWSADRGNRESLFEMKGRIDFERYR